MKLEIRHALDTDEAEFVRFVLGLAKFNRSNHDDNCTVDAFEPVLEAIEERARDIFRKRNENTLILIALVDGKASGYALGRILMQEPIAENGTGRYGLFDELFLDDSARGCGLGQKLTDEVLDWMKQQGIARVKIHAYAWNTHAQKIYRQNGFNAYAISYEKFI